MQEIFVHNGRSELQWTIIPVLQMRFMCVNCAENPGLVSQLVSYKILIKGLPPEDDRPTEMGMNEPGYHGLWLGFHKMKGVTNMDIRQHHIP